MRPLAVAAMAWLVAVADVAAAATFSIAPLGLSISPREAAGSVVAINAGDAPVVLQVTPLAWSQRDGKDVRDETRDLIVNPPIFKLGPGEQQLVRFASRTGPPRDAEAAYRAVFTEVLPKDAPAGPSGFRISLGMDIPVYVEPVAALAPAPIAWRAERTATGARVVAENPGNVHFRITDARFTVDGAEVHSQGIVALLPKSWLAFELKAPPRAAGVIHLTAQDSANKPVSVDIPLAPAP
jgi:fimbrial chaperone protein